MGPINAIADAKTVRFDSKLFFDRFHNSYRFRYGTHQLRHPRSPQVGLSALAGVSLSLDQVIEPLRCERGYYRLLDKNFSRWDIGAEYAFRALQRSNSCTATIRNSGPALTYGAGSSMDVGEYPAS